MIKIISGTYGFRDGNRVIPKNHLSEPFSLDKEKEERLIKKGVAVRVENKVPVGDAEGISDDEDDADKLPEYNMKMKTEQLLEVALLYGVDASKCRTKQEIIDLIDESLKDPESVGDVNEDELKFDAKSPVETDENA